MAGTQAAHAGGAAGAGVAAGYAGDAAAGDVARGCVASRRHRGAGHRLAQTGHCHARWGRLAGEL